MSFPPDLFRWSLHLVLRERVKAFGEASRLLIGMDPLKMLRNLRFHEFQCSVRADLHTLGFSYTLSLAKITHHGTVVGGRIKSRHGGRTRRRALSAGRPKASIGVHHHMEFLFVVMNCRGIDRAGLLTFPLFL
jgi:hypothetical protein